MSDRNCQEEHHRWRIWIGRLGGIASVAQFVIGIPASIASVDQWQEIFVTSPLSVILAVIGIVLIVATFLPIRPFVTKKSVQPATLEREQDPEPTQEPEAKQEQESTPRDGDPKASGVRRRTYVDSPLRCLMNEAEKYTNIAWSSIVSKYIGKWVPETAVEVLNVSKYGEDEISIPAKFWPRKGLSVDYVSLRFDRDSGVEGVPRGEVLRITGEIKMIGAHDAELIHCEIIGRIDARPDQGGAPDLQNP